MVEREGFEPSMGFWAHTPLAGERLRPLGHLSQISGEVYQSGKRSKAIKDYHNNKKSRDEIIITGFLANSI
jgi:hypothetical protein